MAPPTNVQSGPLVVAGILGAGGIALILYAVAKGGGAPTPGISPLRAGEAMGQPTSPNVEGAAQIQIRRGDTFAALRPTVTYLGTGRDTFTQFSIRQQQGGQWVTVYASGVAGVHVGPSPQLANWDLVSPQQLQPAGCPGQSLCCFPFPGVGPNPICGAPAAAGPASAYLEVFQRVENITGPWPAGSGDDPGFASPTCNGRIPVAVKVWPNKIMFV